MNKQANFARTTLVCIYEEFLYFKQFIVINIFMTIFTYFQGNRWTMMLTKLQHKINNVELRSWKTSTFFPICSCYTADETEVRTVLHIKWFQYEKLISVFLNFKTRSSPSFNIAFFILHSTPPRNLEQNKSVFFPLFLTH